MESKLLTTVQKCHDDTLIAVEKLDPATDAGIFIRSALGNVDASERAANVQFKFLPWNGGPHAADTIIDRVSERGKINVIIYIHCLYRMII